MAYTKDTVIGDVVMDDPESIPMFLDMGMHCIGCELASGETIEEACLVHGIDPDELLSRLNERAEKLSEEEKEVGKE